MVHMQKEVSDKVRTLKTGITDISYFLQNRIEDRIGQLEKDLTDRSDSFEHSIDEKKTRLLIKKKLDLIENRM